MTHMHADDPNVIVDTGNIAEERGDEFGDTIGSDMAAADRPTDAKIEFHVSMRSWTQRDMEDLVVEAAAQKLVSGWTDRDLSKRIEERAISLIQSKIDAKLETITAEIINQPVIPKGYGKSEPVTMAEMIGLHAREYLQTRVDANGNPTKATWGTSLTRIERLASDILTRDFNNVLQKERNNLLVSARDAIAAKEKEIISQSREEIRNALGKYLKDPKK